MGVYITEFSGPEDIAGQYRIPIEELSDCNIILAWYGYGDYCGSSLVVFEKNGELYEVNACHCSSYGLEGQWTPEETSWNALATRDLSGSYDGSREAHNALQAEVKKHL